MKNSYSDLLKFLRKSSDLYVIELVDRVDQQKEFCLAIFLSAISLLLVIYIFTIPVINSVNRQKDKVLSLFCEIDQKVVKHLHFRCERFLSKVENEDGDGDIETHDDSFDFY
jgi:hypothetical protein